jgi:hypothetical protein
MFSRERDFKSWNKRWAGYEAGTKSASAIRIDIQAETMLAHRVAWAIYYGNWPLEVIDHINGNPHDNKIKNLRDVSVSQNQKNQGRRKNNLSGYVGIRMCKRPAKWRAEIKINGRTKHLGYFDDIKDAITARENAKIENGFTKRHGV